MLTARVKKFRGYFRYHKSSNKQKDLEDCTCCYWHEYVKSNCGSLPVCMYDYYNVYMDYKRKIKAIPKCRCKHFKNKQ